MIVHVGHHRFAVGNCRTWLAFIAVGFASSGVGTLLGQAPTWPDRRLWAAVAFSASAVTTLYIIWPRVMWLRRMTTVCLAVSMLRGVGYLFAARTAAMAFAGAGVWAIVTASVLRAHRHERKHLV